jgi:hypothetical protein
MAFADDDLKPPPEAAFLASMITIAHNWVLNYLAYEELEFPPMNGDAHPMKARKTLETLGRFGGTQRRPQQLKLSQAWLPEGRLDLQRSPELTRGCSREVDHPEFPPMTRASVDAHEASLPHLPSLVCAGPARRPSPACLFGHGVSDGPARTDAIFLASS